MNNYFDQVILINLSRRRDRLATTLQELNTRKWDFKQPERFDAIDGNVQRSPPDWKSTPGAWGCMQSHRAVIERAVVQGCNNLLVLEDDILLADQFANQASEFLTHLPAKWDCLMFGGQHLWQPEVFSKFIVRCRKTIKTHCYAVNGPFLQTMLTAFRASNDRCSKIMANLSGYYRFFAPTEFIAGQRAGYSDIWNKTSLFDQMGNQKRDAELSLKARRLSICHRCEHGAAAPGGFESVCRCALDGIPITRHAEIGSCRIDRFSLLLRANDAQTPAPTGSSRQFEREMGKRQSEELSVLWSELHLAALELSTPEERLNFLFAFSARIPSGECETCWTEFVRTSIPKTDSRDEMFAWTVDAHNHVNTILGKPLLSIAQAHAVWTHVRS